MTWKNIGVGDIKNNIIRQIHTRLQRLLKNQYDFFIKYIKTNQIALSGSFILQCILGEYWDNSDIDMYLYTNTDKDNYFDVLEIEKEVLTYEKIQAIKNEYADFIDITHIINRKVFDKRIQTIKISCDESYDGFKKFVLTTFDLDICKNIFQYVNGVEVVYVHDFGKLINRRDNFDGNFLLEKTKKRIYKYINRGFDISGKLTMDKYFKYSVNSMPFLVFKNDKNGRFEKLTFLDKVMNRDDIIKCLEERGGNIIIDIDINKCERINKRWIFGYDFKHLFETFLNGNCLENNKNLENGKCYCHVDLCGIRHKHYRQIAYPIHNNNNKNRICDFLVIDYDDLGDVMKDEYNEIFEMKCEIENKYIEIEDELLYDKFWKKYWTIFDLKDITIKDDDVYDVLEKINVNVANYHDEHRARYFERGPVKGRYYNREYDFDYDKMIGKKWYDYKKKLLKDIGDDDLIVINGVKYQKKGFIVGNLGYLDVGVCYKVMDVMKN